MDKAPWDISGHAIGKKGGYILTYLVAIAILALLYYLSMHIPSTHSVPMP